MFLQNTFGISDKELDLIIMLSEWLVSFVCLLSLKSTKYRGDTIQESRLTEQLTILHPHFIHIVFSWCHNSGITLFLSFFRSNWLYMTNHSSRVTICCSWLSVYERQIGWQQKCLNQVCGGCSASGKKNGIVPVNLWSVILCALKMSCLNMLQGPGISLCCILMKF